MRLGCEGHLTVPDDLCLASARGDGLRQIRRAPVVQITRLQAYPPERGRSPVTAVSVFRVPRVRIRVTHQLQSAAMNCPGSRLTPNTLVASSA